MKSKTIIISLLLTLFVLGMTIGKIYIPIVSFAVGVLVVLSCLVYYVLKLLRDEKMHFDEKFQNINANLFSAKNEILQSQTMLKEQIITDIADKHISTQQLISQGIDSLQEVATEKINTVIELISAQSEKIDNKFKDEAELIGSLSEMTQSLSAEILNKITCDSMKIEGILNKTAEQLKNEGESTRKFIEDASNKIFLILDLQKEVIGNAIEASTDSIANISRENKDILIKSVSELSSQEMSSREVLSISLTDVLQNANELKGLIEACHESVTNVIDDRGNKISDNITKFIVDSIGNVTDYITKTQMFLTEAKESLLQIYNLQASEMNSNILSSIDRIDTLKGIINSSVSQFVEILDDAKLQTDEINRNVESVKQQNNILQESIANNNERIANSEIAIVTSTSQQKSDIVEHILQNRSNISGTIEQSVSKVLTTLIENIVQTKAIGTKTEETLLQSYKEQTHIINKAVKDIVEHFPVLQYTLDDTNNKVSEQTGIMDKIIKTSIQEMNDSFIYKNAKVSASITTSISTAVNKIEEFVEKTAKFNNDNAELLSESMVEMANTISNKIDVIEKQNNALATDIESLDDYQKGNAGAIESIREHFDSLQKGVASVQIQSNNVENFVNEFAKNNSNIAIIDSIKSMIAELHQELKAGISDINDEILETQIKQESINDELDKLQILLRNISKKSIQEVMQVQVPSTSFPTSTNEGPKPNRTETIVDSETNNIVYNQSVGGKLAKSTMKDKKGHIIYELEYNDGKIFRSRNYDAKGVMNIEQTYYDNGQVHYRNEKTINGNISTEFDVNGNKK